VLAGVIVFVDTGVAVVVLVDVVVAVIVEVRVEVLVEVKVADLVGVVVRVRVGVLLGRTAVDVAVRVGVLVGGTAVAVFVRVAVRVGLAVGDGTPAAPAQKPPLTVKLPPDCVPAPGCPIVPPNVNWPPVLAAPPPPLMVPHDRSKLPPTWALASILEMASVANTAPPSIRRLVIENLIISNLHDV